MFHRKKPKRYGSVKGRGRTNYVPDWNKYVGQKPREPRRYLIPAETKCHVRKLGKKSWRGHVTKTGIVCVGFLWRNSTHYGFAYCEWEVKVPVGAFSEVG